MDRRDITGHVYTQPMDKDMDKDNQALPRSEEGKESNGAATDMYM